LIDEVKEHDIPTRGTGYRVKFIAAHGVDETTSKSRQTQTFASFASLF
jgi:hypothetical protein